MSIPTKVMIYPNNDQVHTLTGLQDVLTDLYQDTATVTMTLFDQLGNPVAGLTNITLNYVSGSNGDYNAAVPAFSYGPPPNPDQPILGGFTLQVTAVQSGVQYQINIPAEMDLRRS
jgi:hypothetical protein